LTELTPTPRPPGRRRRHCPECGSVEHDRRTCPELAAARARKVEERKNAAAEESEARVAAALSPAVLLSRISMLERRVSAIEEERQTGIGFRGQGRRR
jgi:hypothetical protein